MGSWNLEDYWMHMLIIPIPKEEYDRLMEYKYAIERVTRIIDGECEGSYIDKQRILDVLPEENIYG